MSHVESHDSVCSCTCDNADIKLQDFGPSNCKTRNRNRMTTGLTVGVCFLVVFLYMLLQRLGVQHCLIIPPRFHQPLQTWTYEATRDAGNYGLSEEQCNIAFPKLYRPIEASMARLVDGIAQVDTMGDIHWGECRAMIYDNEIYVLDDWPDDIGDNRKFATLHAINRALIAVASTGERFPNIEFSLAFGDRNADLSRPNWAYDRLVTDNLTVLIPDFGLYSWPAHNVGTYTEVRRRVQHLGNTIEFENKIAQLVWRGSVEFGSDVRNALLNASLGKPWSAVEAIHWQAPDFEDHVLTMADHCRYQFVAQTEGLAYSGRLKYLHNCESVIVAHDFSYETHDQHLMIDSGPEQNYVLVKRDFSDLSEKMDWLLAHPEEAARIARNNAAVFRDRYLTPAAEACYWRKLIHEWGKKSNFEPQFFRDGTKEWRGVPYESFALQRKLHWDAQAVG